MNDLPPDALAAILQEPKQALLARVLRLLGPARTSALLVETLHCEAAGGMLTRDGSRRRTLGGVFFQRVKAQATRDARRQLFGR